MAWTDLAAAANVGCRDVFGVSVTYSPAAGDPVTITAIHDAPGTLVTLGSVATQTTAHTLDVVESDLAAAPAAGDTVTIGAVTYEVAQVEPDGNGMSKLYLLET